MLEKSFGLLFLFKARQKSKGKCQICVAADYSPGKSCRAIHKKAMEYQTLEFHSWKSDRQQGGYQNA